MRFLRVELCLLEAQQILSYVKWIQVVLLKKFQLLLWILDSLICVPVNVHSKTHNQIKPMITGPVLMFSVIISVSVEFWMSRGLEMKTAYPRSWQASGPRGAHSFWYTNSQKQWASWLTALHTGEVGAPLHGAWIMGAHRFCSCAVSWGSLKYPLAPVGMGRGRSLNMTCAFVHCSFQVGSSYLQALLSLPNHLL